MKVGDSAELVECGRELLSTTQQFAPTRKSAELNPSCIVISLCSVHEQAAVITLLNIQLPILDDAVCRKKRALCKKKTKTNTTNLQRVCLPPIKDTPNAENRFSYTAIYQPPFFCCVLQRAVEARDTLGKILGKLSRIDGEKPPQCAWRSPTRQQFYVRVSCAMLPSLSGSITCYARIIVNRWHPTRT